MRYKGKIVEWQDDRGFGFIAPSLGGDKVFAHIKAFRAPGRRPVGGELVTYDLGQDPQGRRRAQNVVFSGEKYARRSAPSGNRWPMIFAVAFLVLLALAVIAGHLPAPALFFYLLMSAATYTVYTWDKVAATNGRWRTSERTLHMLGLLGGWPGALYAQQSLRHKSRKRSFQGRFWVTVAVNCAVLVWFLIRPDGLESVKAGLGTITGGG